MNYWIEIYNSSSQVAQIWVQIPSIPASTSYTIYQYYGNSSASTASSGLSTMDKYDGYEQYSTGALAGQTFNTGDWTKYSGNPVISYGAVSSWEELASTYGSVMLDGSTYKMWYQGTDASNVDRIGYATSSDGKTWTKYAGNPIMSPGTSGAWDDGAVRVPQVWKEGSTYYMIYTGKNVSTAFIKVGLATSSDGITWTKSGSNPVFNDTNSWTGHQTEGCENVMKVGSTYYLWYGNISGARQIGIATSTDLINWTAVQNTPIFTTITSSPLKNQICGGAFTYGGYYYALITSQYASVGSGDTQGSKIYLYRSSSPTFPITDRTLMRVVTKQGSAGSWDSGNLDTPYVLTSDITRTPLLNNGQFWVYYGGATGSDYWGVGLMQNDIASSLTQQNIYPLWAVAAPGQSTKSIISTAVTHSGSNSFLLNTQGGVYAVTADINATSGVISYWMYNGGDMYIYTPSNAIAFAIGTNPATAKFRYYDGAFHDTAVAVSSSVWYKIEGKFSVTTGKVDFNVYDASGNQVLAQTGITMGSSPTRIVSAEIYRNNTQTGSIYIDDWNLRQYLSTDLSATLGSENSQITSGITLNNDPTGQSSGKTRITGNANTGNSAYTISDVNYSVNGGGWQGATATDGSFNSSNENFYLDFLPTDNNYSQDGYTIRVKAQSSSGVWQDNLFYFQPFNLDSPANNSFTINSLPTFGFSINKGEFSNLKDNLSKFQVLINKDNKGWQTYLDDIPVDYENVKNSGDNLQRTTLSTNGNGIYEDKKLWVSFENNNAKISVYAKDDDKLFEDGGHELSSGSYQWKVAAVNKAGHTQETGARQLRVNQKQFYVSKNWFPLTIESISDIGSLDLSTLHPQDIKNEYFTSIFAPTIKGIANAGTTVTLIKDDGTSANTYTAVTGTDSRYLITFPDNSLRYGRPYTITLSVKDSGDNYNELPAFKLGIGSLASDTTKIEQATGSPTLTPRIEEPTQPTPTPKPPAIRKHCFLFICW